MLPLYNQNAYQSSVSYTGTLPRLITVWCIWYSCSIIWLVCLVEVADFFHGHWKLILQDEYVRWILIQKVVQYSILMTKGKKKKLLLHYSR